MSILDQSIEFQDNDKDNLKLNLIDDKEAQVSEVPPELTDDEARKNYKKVIFLGINYVCLFSCFNSTANIMSQIFDQLNYENLGQINLATIYIVLAGNNLFSSYIVESTTFKKIMIFSSFGYVIQLGIGTLACVCENHEGLFFCKKGIMYPLNVFGAMICGFCASLIWLASSGYVTNICNAKTKGKFFSTFWAMVQTSQVWGNLLIIFILKYCSHFVYYFSLFCGAGASAFGFLLLPNVENRTIKYQKTRKTVKEKVNVFLGCLKNNHFQRAFMFCCFSGIIIGTYQGFLYRVVQDNIFLSKATNSDDDIDREKNVKTGYCFLTLGLCEFIGGMINSRVSDKFDQYFLSTFGVNLIQLGMVFTYFAHSLENYALCFIAAACFGAGECICQSLLNRIMATDLGNILEGFAVYRLGQGIGVMVTSVLSITLKNANKWIFICIVFVFSTWTHLAVSALTRKKFLNEKKRWEDEKEQLQEQNDKKEKVE